MRRLWSPAALLCLLALAGCGGSASANPPSTPRAKATVAKTPTVGAAVIIATPTAAAAATAPSTPTPVATATPLPTATPVVASEPQVIAASILPATVPAAGAVHLSVSLTGRASKVEIYLSSGPGGAGPVTYRLVNSGGNNWTATGTAPSTAGSYHYSVGVYDVIGHRNIDDNDSWNVQVGGSSGPQSLPDDVPLAPPFSYGNPQVAVFSAEGHTVSGSEVVSNSRPDVLASTVAHFYEVQFPRAGWTLDQSTVPASGATSFTIAATKGANRVCVVQFAGGTVQVYYGSYASG